jgi:hypothetical protein
MASRPPASLVQRFLRLARTELEFRKAQVASAFRWAPGPAETDRAIWKFDAKDPDTLADWVKSSDEVLGGLSRCTFTVNDDNVAVFEGVVRLNPAGSTADRGYCAVRAAIPRLHSDLSDYEGLGLRLRMDGNVYAFNVKAKSFFPDDMYQVGRHAWWATVVEGSTLVFFFLSCPSCVRCL